MSAAPVFIGEIGAASDGGGSVGTLSITTTADVPGPSAPVGCVVIALVLAMIDGSGSSPTFNPSTITDDSAGANTYALFPEGANNALSYDVGRPGPGPLGSSGTFGAQSDAPPTGCSVILIYMFPTADMPAGTTISIPLAGHGIGGGNYQDAAAMVLGFASATDYNSPAAAASGQLIDPTDVQDETGANVPLGDHTFSEMTPDGSQFVCLVGIQGSSVSGSGTIDDPSGNWTKVDGGDFFGDLVEYGLFVVDGDTVDQAESIIQFTESGFGVNVDSCWTICPVPAASVTPPATGVPALNGVVPV